MEEHVLAHEPHTALFVEDTDPLLFYRRITELAQEGLTQGGKLYFEINEAFAKETIELMESIGFKKVESFQDMQGKLRMVKAVKK